MKQIFSIIKKEFKRFFKDPRLFVTTIFLPGILIFAMYSLMGNVMSAVEGGEDYVPTAYVYNMPDSLNQALGGVLNINKEQVTLSEAMAQVKDGGIDAVVVFPEDFDRLIAQPSEQPAPNVEIYYNSADGNSSAAYYTVGSVLDAFETSLSNLFDVNAGDKTYDVADSQSITTYILSMVVPIVLLMMLFSGCIATVLEAIAGEKERGTIATLLVTPMKRSHLAIGKILALSVIAMLSGVSSFLGIVLSLPQLLKGVEGLTLSMYGALDYLALFGIIISTVLVLVSLMTIVSAYSKSVKEANSLVIPLMIIVMLCGFASIFTKSTNIGLFFIPLFNSALCISGVMSGTLTAAMFAIAVCMNLAFTVLLVYVLTLMFKSEKIMFNR